MPVGFREFEAVLGALSKMTSDETRSEDLLDARCPKCESSSFIKVTDLYDEASLRAEEEPQSVNMPRDGGVTDAQAIARFAPPQRRSPTPRIAFAAVLLGAAVYAVYRYFGDTAAQLAGAGAALGRVDAGERDEHVRVLGGALGDLLVRDRRVTGVGLHIDG